MASKDAPADCVEPNRSPVIPLPIALYISNDLIFELYNGGAIPACPD